MVASLHEALGDLQAVFGSVESHQSTITALQADNVKILARLDAIETELAAFQAWMKGVFAAAAPPPEPTLEPPPLNDISLPEAVPSEG